MSSFDVLTVSKRVGWQGMAAASMQIQTERPRRWIVVHEGPDDGNIYLDMAGAEIYPAPAPKAVSNLNASLNHGLKLCTSRYVVFYQDFIELPKDCLARLLKAAEFFEGRAFITTLTTDETGRPEGNRYTGADVLRPCLPEEWEANVAIAPLDAIRALGGFDEEYDNGWSWDNVNLAERAAMLGYEFYCDETNRPRLHPHVKEPEANPRLLPNGEFHARRMSDIKSGTLPLALPYL